MSERRLIGIGTPQANPTVEIEFQQFMRGPVQPLFTRLQSKRADYEGRLLDYLHSMPDSLASFGGLPLAVYAFACTGSAYLAGAEAEEEMTESLERQFRLPVVTATQAIRRELQGHGVQRLALLAPYPEPLCAAAIRYWEQLGFDVVASRRIDVGDDTRAIYALEDERVEMEITSFDTRGADMLLLSGTGMPTMRCLRTARVPMISSNLCLAVEALRRTRLWPPAQAANIHALTSSLREATHA